MPYENTACDVKKQDEGITCNLKETFKPLLVHKHSVSLSQLGQVWRPMDKAVAVITAAISTKASEKWCSNNKKNLGMF